MQRQQCIVVAVGGVREDRAELWVHRCRNDAYKLIKIVKQRLCYRSVTKCTKFDLAELPKGRLHVNHSVFFFSSV